MTEQEVIDKVCDRMMITLYNELDDYMCEEVGHTETDNNYVKEADRLARLIIKELIK